MVQLRQGYHGEVYFLLEKEVTCIKEKFCIGPIVLVINPIWLILKLKRALSSCRLMESPFMGKPFQVKNGCSNKVLGYNIGPFITVEQERGDVDGVGILLEELLGLKEANVCIAKRAYGGEAWKGYLKGKILMYVILDDNVMAKKRQKTS
ncbi:hypothetical protein GOBAR_AA15246 [Gossypium barbadense]|uniref:Uncharacterized protein n=1 Tax=Gossypium barbadense TaxID=3634 RepID=A0A2P5XQ14_GOSBA|nr:hypothetical protein GOBAR_AA15246 [Gossypium barbadense]